MQCDEWAELVTPCLTDRVAQMLTSRSADFARSREWWPVGLLLVKEKTSGPRNLREHGKERVAVRRDRARGNGTHLGECMGHTD